MGWRAGLGVALLMAAMGGGPRGARRAEAKDATRAAIGVVQDEDALADAARGGNPTAAPIDVTMTRLRGLEVAGFDPGHLSSSARNLFALAGRWSAVRKRLMGGASTKPLIALRRGTNLSKSRFSGFTQSQTATAWCGANVVIGFNDTGAEVVTMGSGRGVSMDGYAQSSNSGATFTYMGSPAPPADPNTFMAGDPVVACANANTFYYVSSFLDGTNKLSGVSLSISTDGGKIFSEPIMTAGQSSGNHIVGGPWIAVDRNTPSRLYVSYTDLDFSGAICGAEGGSAVPRYAIEIISSADGGATWSATPVTVAEVCADSAHEFAFVGGGRVAVAPNGGVYVAWELFGDAGNPVQRQIEIAGSDDHARSFASPITVATVGCAGDCADWQGLAHSNEFPSLAIGRGPSSGMVYLAWNDGDRQAPDAVTTLGMYNFTDIMFSQSADGGATWSAPVRVNSNPEGGGESPTDHFEPALAADRNGRIGICFYDRRNDNANFLIDRFCASSHNGKNWTNHRITLTSFPTIVGQDVLLAPDYMGDYDTLASDDLDEHTGFIGGYASNLTGNPVARTLRY